MCLCVRYQTPFSSRHESGPSLFLLTGKHPVVRQLPRVSFSGLPGQSSDRLNLPPHKKTFDFSVYFRQYSESTLRSMQKTREAIEESIVQRPNGQVRSFREPPSRPSFSTGPWSPCIVTGHDRMMTVENNAIGYCMLHASRLQSTFKQPRAVCLKCFMFHLGRDRLRRSSCRAIMPAIDRC